MTPEREAASSPQSSGPIPAVRLICQGCGHRVPLDEPEPFRCPRAGEQDDVDHLLTRVLDPAGFSDWGDAEGIFDNPEPNPFRRYRKFLYSYQIARAGGLSDERYLELVDRLDRAVAEVDGRGFAATPFQAQDGLGRAVSLEPGRLRVKDETGSVAGSHKARHLMGILLWLEVAERLRSEVRPGRSAGWGEGEYQVTPSLAIASCGNAALAACVLARAAGRPLEVFVPPDARPAIRRRLEELQAELRVCPRRAQDRPGDPCFLRFLEALERGSLPFSVQGPQNGLTLEGGSTLIWEILSSLRSEEEALDHLFVQVGGGALTTACVTGFREARALGLVDRLPRIHTVQTASAWPLRRAWLRLVGDLLDLEIEADRPVDLETEKAWALRIRDQVTGDRLCAALDHAARHRSRYMRPWETEPRSIAYGILDDETYDWLAVAGGMLETGGVPLVVGEETLAEAHQLGRERTGIPAEPTGTAGLAGLLEARRAGLVDPGETAAVLFTGVER